MIGLLTSYQGGGPVEATWMGGWKCEAWKVSREAREGGGGAKEKTGCESGPDRDTIIVSRTCLSGQHQGSQCAAGTKKKQKQAGRPHGEGCVTEASGSHISWLSTWGSGPADSSRGHPGGWWPVSWPSKSSLASGPAGRVSSSSSPPAPPPGRRQPCRLDLPACLGELGDPKRLDGETWRASRG
jgi:hypothetical protein